MPPQITACLSFALLGSGTLSIPKVLIQDSITISMHYQLASVYPACGGGRTKATTKLKGAIKLQTTLDARSGLVQNISEVSKMLENLTKLITTSLFDLGYFSQKGLKKMVSQNARFGCRLNTQCGLYRTVEKQVQDQR